MGGSVRARPRARAVYRTTVLRASTYTYGTVVRTHYLPLASGSFNRSWCIECQTRLSASLHCMHGPSFLPHHRGRHRAATLIDEGRRAIASASELYIVVISYISFHLRTKLEGRYQTIKDGTKLEGRRTKLRSRGPNKTQDRDLT